MDPARSKREFERELERINHARNAFLEKKINLVCLVAGGFAECLRECVVRKVEPNLVDVGSGAFFCDYKTNKQKLNEFKKKA